MDIASLLERLRDAFVIAKDPLLGDDGALKHRHVNDIEIAVRVRCAVWAVFS